MPTQVQFRRGTTAQNNNFTGAAGELSVNTSNVSLRIHDGSTVGGKEAALINNPLSQFATTTSAQLRGIISDETGTGSLVFGTSPTVDSPIFLTPNIGTPSYAVMTNATGTAPGLTANVGTNITITDDTSTAATHYLTYVAGTSGDRPTKVSSSKLTFNPSSGLLTSTDYNSSSDKRLKKTIKQIDGALEKVNKLKGVSFEWKESGTQALGLIAQDVEKVIPELVTTDDNGFKGIRYNNIIAVLVEAIKEQQDQIKVLQDQVKKLNG